MNSKIKKFFSCVAFLAFLCGNRAVAQLETVKAVEQVYGLAKKLYDDFKVVSAQDYEIYKNEVILSSYSETNVEAYREVPELYQIKVVKEVYLNPGDNKTLFFNEVTTEYNRDGTPKPATRSDKPFKPSPGKRDYKCGRSPFTRSTSQVTTTYRLNNIIVQKAKNPKANGVDNHNVVAVFNGVETWPNCADGTDVKPKKWEISLAVGRDGYREFSWEQPNSKIDALPFVVYTKQDLVAMDRFGKGYNALTKDRREEVDVAIAKGDK